MPRPGLSVNPLRPIDSIISGVIVPSQVVGSRLCIIRRRGIDQGSPREYLIRREGLKLVAVESDSFNPGKPVVRPAR